MLFKDLHIIPPILKALEREKYLKATPIQEKAIPHILAGKDVMGAAQTGTGKTAAFAIPILQLLSREKELSNTSRNIKCLVLTPTRELAIQIEENFLSYGKGLGLRHCVIFGGVSQHSQVLKLKKGVDIVVATPGRLLDLMNQGYVDLHKVEIFTLDEADRMLNMGFINDVKKVITKLPVKRQTLLFSATMPKEILSLAHSILINPISIEVTPVSSTAETVKQSVYFVSKNDKKNLLTHLLKNTKIKAILVFTRTKHGADRVVKELAMVGVVAEAIHGNKSQNARQRALNNFKGGQTRVLIATDIAARGIDVVELGHVINYDLPNEPETYIHRIGRTGRAGLFGNAYSFCNQEEVEYLLDIQKLIGKSIDVVHEHPFAITVDENVKSPKQTKQKKVYTEKRLVSGNSKRNQRRSKNRRAEKTL
ncbi:MAG: DEAD/DEAH box helicase [Candidatus Gracilibacteria bacterium]|nr:DEAD/DEAH box helicase [Candidatus Gracilibacteria bacterium]